MNSHEEKKREEEEKEVINTLYHGKCNVNTGRTPT